eukprot:764377_1
MLKRKPCGNQLLESYHANRRINFVHICWMYSCICKVCFNVCGFASCMRYNAYIHAYGACRTIFMFTICDCLCFYNEHMKSGNVIKNQSVFNFMGIWRSKWQCS